METLDLFVEQLLGELASDQNFANKATALEDGIKKINKGMLEVMNELKKPSEIISDDERIRLEFLQLYTVNTLYYINLKLQGVDMTRHPIKDELMRVKDAMKQHSLLMEKARPRLDKRAAERFIRSGLWDPAQAHQPANKKTKFEDI